MHITKKAGAKPVACSGFFCPVFLAGNKNAALAISANAA
jgi:hypothetical protein